MTSKRTGIALGSNLGDRIANLQEAVGSLIALQSDDSGFLASSVYQTEPRFCPTDSPTFLNGVVEFSWNGSPEALHEETLSIESKLGRLKTNTRNAPRLIDLDILYIGEMKLATERLQLPHPRMVERRFVLQPLAEIRPDLSLPGWNATADELLGSLDSDEPPAVKFPDSLLARTSGRLHL